MDDKTLAEVSMIECADFYHVDSVNVEYALKHFERERQVHLIVVKDIRAIIKALKIYKEFLEEM